MSQATSIQRSHRQISNAAPRTRSSDAARCVGFGRPKANSTTPEQVSSRIAETADARTTVITTRRADGKPVLHENASVSEDRARGWRHEKKVCRVRTAGR